MGKPKGLTKRLVYSVAILSFVWLCIFKAGFIIFLLINSAVIALSLFEFYSFMEKKGLHPNKTIGIIFGLFFPYFIYFPGEPIIFGASILALSFLNFDPDDEYGGIINTSVTLMGLLYVGLFCSFFTKIRFLPHGAMWIAYIITVTKMGDAGAYFIGTTFGKTKPKKFKKISPNKTVEGAIGGLCFSILASVMFKIFLPSFPMKHFFILGIVLAFIGQVGDLTESLIKRECNVKDSGVIPGLGGILDIMDSLLFTAPFLFYYLKVLLQ